MKTETKSSFKALMGGLAIAAATLSTAAYAGSKPGEALSAVDIKSRGELTLTAKKDVEYKPWSSKSLMTGQTTILMHMPARMSAETHVQPLREALEARAWSPKEVRVVSIVNLDDAMFGASAFIAGELKKNKIEQPSAIMVIDNDGKAFKAWDMKKKTIGVMVVDNKGVVRHRHYGEFNAAQVKAVMDTVTQLNGSASVSATAAGKASVKADAKVGVMVE